MVRSSCSLWSENHSPHKGQHMASQAGQQSIQHLDKGNPMQGTGAPALAHHVVTSSMCQKYQSLVWTLLKSFRRSLLPLMAIAVVVGGFPDSKKVKWDHHKKECCSQPGDTFRGNIPSSAQEAAERPDECRSISLLEDLCFWRREVCKSYTEKLDHPFIPKRLLQILADMSEQTDL